MSNFNEREKDFENKYAYDEKINFRVEARTAKLFGLWAAGKMGLDAQAMQDYAMDTVAKNLESPGFDDVIKKVAGDLKAKGLDVSDHLLKTEADTIADEARRQIMSETAAG